MEDKEALHIQNALNIYHSLAVAVTTAGGCILSPNELRHISAMELLTFLSNNNIAFVCTLETK